MKHNTIAKKLSMTALAAAMVAAPAVNVFAATASSTIDTNHKCSLTIHKYDITAATAKGFDKDKYKATGAKNAAAEAELANYSAWYENPYQLTDFILMTLIGFLIYGPVMLIGLHALELAPKKAAGTAAGFTGLFGYLGGTVSASAVIGWAAQHYGWDGGFYVMIGGGVLAVLLLFIVMVEEGKHKAKLGDTYGK